MSQIIREADFRRTFCVLETETLENNLIYELWFPVITEYRGDKRAIDRLYPRLWILISKSFMLNNLKEHQLILLGLLDHPEVALLFREGEKQILSEYLLQHRL